MLTEKKVQSKMRAHSEGSRISYKKAPYFQGSQYMHKKNGVFTGLPQIANHC